MKEIKLGFIDLNKTEIKRMGLVEFYNRDRLMFKQSSEFKFLIEEFCNKVNKAKVYEIILREVK